MAATAVYASIIRIRKDPEASDSQSYSNINATTSAFTLKGGSYNVDIIGSTFGTVTLQRLGPDQSTWLAAMTAFAANGTATADLVSGSYRLLLA
jgi:hypothetical protein